MPDNFPIQQKDRLFYKATVLILFEKQPSLLLNGEVIWQARDSFLTKELHALDNTNLRGSITVRLTSCLFCLDSAALLLLNEQHFCLVGQIQTSQTRGQLYSDTSPYGEYSMDTSIQS